MQQDDLETQDVGLTFVDQIDRIAVLVDGIQAQIEARRRLDELATAEDPPIPGEFHFYVGYQGMLFPLPPDTALQVEDFAALIEPLRRGNADATVKLVEQLGAAVDNLCHWCDSQRVRPETRQDEHDVSDRIVAALPRAGAPGGN
jgi:hypothetical protein